MTDKSAWSEVFVVGDGFSTFAENPSVVTMSALRTSLEAGRFTNGAPVRLRPGLGVCDYDWGEVQAVLAATRRADQRMAVASPPVTKLPTREVLKRDHANVLLAGLCETGASSYRADLVVSQDTEMILDHTAERQHIPGMLLMEACCQMLIAATGRFLARQRPDRSYYAVMQHFEIDFRRFVFPLPAHLELTIESWGETELERPEFVSSIDIMQGGEQCSRARWRYRAFPPERLFGAEAAQAERAIAIQRQSLPDSRTDKENSRC